MEWKKCESAGGSENNASRWLRGRSHGGRALGRCLLDVPRSRLGIVFREYALKTIDLL